MSQVWAIRSVLVALQRSSLSFFNNVRDIFPKEFIFRTWPKPLRVKISSHFGGRLLYFLVGTLCILDSEHFKSHENVFQDLLQRFAERIGSKMKFSQMGNFVDITKTASYQRSQLWTNFGPSVGFSYVRTESWKQCTSNAAHKTFFWQWLNTARKSLKEEEVENFLKSIFPCHALVQNLQQSSHAMVGSHAVARHKVLTVQHCSFCSICN